MQWQKLIEEMENQRHEHASLTRSHQLLETQIAEAERNVASFKQNANDVSAQLTMANLSLDQASRELTETRKFNQNKLNSLEAQNAKVETNAKQAKETLEKQLAQEVMQKEKIVQGFKALKNKHGVQIKEALKQVADVKQEKTNVVEKLSQLVSEINKLNSALTAQRNLNKVQKEAAQADLTAMQNGHNNAIVTLNSELTTLQENAASAFNQYTQEYAQINEDLEKAQQAQVQSKKQALAQETEIKEVFEAKLAYLKENSVEQNKQSELKYIAQEKAFKESKRQAALFRREIEAQLTFETELRVATEESQAAIKTQTQGIVNDFTTKLNKRDKALLALEKQFSALSDDYGKQKMLYTVSKTSWQEQSKKFEACIEQEVTLRKDIESALDYAHKVFKQRALKWSATRKALKEEIESRKQALAEVEFDLHAKEGAQREAIDAHSKQVKSEMDKLHATNAQNDANMANVKDKHVQSVNGLVTKVTSIQSKYDLLKVQYEQAAQVHEQKRTTQDQRLDEMQKRLDTQTAEIIYQNGVYEKESAIFNQKITQYETEQRSNDTLMTELQSKISKQTSEWTQKESDAQREKLTDVRALESTKEAMASQQGQLSKLQVEHDDVIVHRDKTISLLKRLTKRYQSFKGEAEKAHADSQEEIAVLNKKVVHRGERTFEVLEICRAQKVEQKALLEKIAVLEQEISLSKTKVAKPKKAKKASAVKLQASKQKRIKEVVLDVIVEGNQQLDSDKVM